MATANPTTPATLDDALDACELAGVNFDQAKAVLRLIQSGADTLDTALFAVASLLDAAITTHRQAVDRRLPVPCTARARNSAMEAQASHEMPALPPHKRQRALTLAQEIQERGDRHLALVGAIEDRLTPSTPGEDSPEYSAWKLAEVLYELLADAALMNELIALLEPDEARQATE